MLKEIFKSGADKISINTAAIEDPDVIDKFVKNYGSQKHCYFNGCKKNK